MLLFAVRRYRHQQQMLQQQQQQLQLQHQHQQLQHQHRQRQQRQQQLQQEQPQEKLQLLEKSIGDHCEKFGDTAQNTVGVGQQQDNIFTAQAFLQKMQHMHAFMAADLHACDIKWSLFVAAAMSYRYEVSLYPYPESYVDPISSKLNLTQLYDVISEMPKLSMVLSNIFAHNYEQFRLRSMDLLHTVIVLGRDPFLRTLEKREYKGFFKCLCQPMPSPRPAHIFEVAPYETNQRLHFYCAMRPSYPLKMAFYGGRLDEYYNLLRTGRATDEQPILLSCDLGMAIEQSRYWPGWGGSVCGPVLKCIAVCEVIQHPDYVSLVEMGDHSGLRVSSDKWMRISYLILYNQMTSGEALQLPQPMLLGEVLLWLQQHKKLVSIGVCMAIMSVRCLIALKRSI